MNDKTLRPPLPKGAVTQIETVLELPEDWWKLVPNDRSAYNYRTRTHLMGIPTETLLDGGAGVNSVPEEVVVGCVNVARRHAVAPSDPKFPLVQLEKWPTPEAVTGISKGHDVPILGAAVLKVTLTEMGKSTGPEIYLRCKIFKKKAPVTGSGSSSELVPWTVKNAEA